MRMLKRIPFYTLRQLTRVLLLSWVIVWLAIFPLIHVHPEADHAHGDAHHQHGGLPHSVLSEDLACEFGKGFHPHQHSSQETHFVAFPDHSHGHSHALGHTEITFSALNPSSDGPLKKPLIVSFGTIEQDGSHSDGPAWGNVVPRQDICSPHHFIKPCFSRPPPTPMV